MRSGILSILVLSRELHVSIFSDLQSPHQSVQTQRLSWSNVPQNVHKTLRLGSVHYVFSVHLHHSEVAAILGCPVRGQLPALDP